MAPKFGTSGLRGLVIELTESLVADYTRAFLAACNCNGTLYVGRDLRPSSPDIADAVMSVARAEGVAVVDCGALPTPALALASMQTNAGAVMVTGSHIPADRNGLKFYVPGGEITKVDEQAIIAHLGRPVADETGTLKTAPDVIDTYERRYTDAFGADALHGLRVGVYQHSAVGRDVIVRVVQALGAQPVTLGRSDVFIPVDTEALDLDTRDLLAGWCKDYGLDAIISTDGDSDRPMLADHTGAIVVGDVLGVLTARYLGADVICTPVSSNSMVLQMVDFKQIKLTRIGSPFVIAAMEDVLALDPAAKVAGYEANGGFLLGFTAQMQHAPLAPLMTRDSLLPMIAPLVAAGRNGCAVADLVADLPRVFTAAGRLQGIAPQVSEPFLDRLTTDPMVRTAFFDVGGGETRIDTTDGLRVTFVGGDVIHLRPSGNAPEFRCYAEAGSAGKAADLVARHLVRLDDILR
ncbi:MAG: phosphomannomutase [Gammaproteobacteria bacterium]|jgi:phosphomannomutase